MSEFDYALIALPIIFIASKVFIAFTQPRPPVISDVITVAIACAIFGVGLINAVFTSF